MLFKEYRTLRNFTQEKLAEVADLDIRTIQRIENEEVTPSIETFRSLVYALDISDEDILEYIKERVAVS